LVTRIKELRDERNLKQQELANLVGVSRQTIYFLEKGSYNPSLTLSLKIAEIFNKTIKEIFYFEPIIKDVLEGKSLSELREVAEIAGISLEKLTSLTEIDDEQLTKSFKEATLTKIARAIGESFDAIFTIE